MASPKSSGTGETHMTENKKETEEKKDWASELINYLLTVVETAQEQLPNGYAIDGLSVQKYDRQRFAINFSFNKKDER